MRDRLKWKVQRKMIAKVLIGGVLVIVAIRFGAETYYMVTDPKTPTVQAAHTDIETPIPDAAKSTGRLFLLNWYYTAAKETADSKAKRLTPYISANVENTLNSQGTMPMSQMTPLRVESWDEKDTWLEKGKRAILNYQVMMEDGRNFFVAVPLVYAGSWQVDGLPALMPSPQKQSIPTPESPDVDNQTLTEIQTALDAFFPMWLSGKNEANVRFVIGQLPLDNVLGEIGGVYDGVAIQPVSENPMTVKALVKVRTEQETLSFEYLVELEEQDGQWKIKSLR